MNEKLLKELNDAKKYIKSMLENNNYSPAKLAELVNLTLRNAYFPNLTLNVRNSFWVILNKLNQATIPAMTMIKKFQATKTSIGLEQGFSRDLVIINRYLLNMIFLVNEIQMLIEQGYQLQAIGRTRLLLETFLMLKISKDLPDYGFEKFYRETLELGNYKWSVFEDYFEMDDTETKTSFLKYAKEKYTKAELEKPYTYFQKYFGKSFTMTTKFKEVFKDEPIMIFIWEQSHNFMHSSSLLFAMEDKEEIFDNTVGYARSLVVYAVLRIYSDVFKMIIDEFENKDFRINDLKEYKKLFMPILLYSSEKECEVRMGIEKLIRDRKKQKSK